MQYTVLRVTQQGLNVEASGARTMPLTGHDTELASAALPG